MILVDNQIEELLKKEIIKPYKKKNINPASYDVTLGSRLLVEGDFRQNEFMPCDISNHTIDNPYLLHPGTFILAETKEVFNFHAEHKVCGQFILKSSVARKGLQHMLAGYIDPGFHNSVLTLELKNVKTYHPVSLYPGMRIGQIVFHKIEEEPAKSYATVGHYNNKKTVERAWDERASLVENRRSK